MYFPSSQETELPQAQYYELGLVVTPSNPVSEAWNYERVINGNLYFKREGKNFGCVKPGQYLITVMIQENSTATDAHNFFRMTMTWTRSPNSTYPILDDKEPNFPNIPKTLPLLEVAQILNYPPSPTYTTPKQVIWDFEAGTKI
jgi:hypothetical protein